MQTNFLQLKYYKTVNVCGKDEGKEVPEKSLNKCWGLK